MSRAGLAAFFFFFLLRPSFAAESPLSVVVKSARLSQGGVGEIRVTGAELQRVEGFLRQREISFFPVERSFAALLGVDLEEKPGAAELLVRAWDGNGEMGERRLTLRVKEKRFPREKLSVPASFDRIDEATRERIKREQLELDRIWAISSVQRWWEGPFVAPLGGGVTSPFGLRRIVNGLARSPHGGVDLKASLGTEVVAANRGRVALREELFFSGKSIVLDHGGGLYTMYFHLDRFRVERDAEVRKGDLIGWVGMTGRVTGPHLHWGVRLNGARVDPFELLEAVK